MPEVRFKKFNKEWEKALLGQKASFTKGQGYSKKDLVEVGAPIILYGRMYTKYESIISEVDTFVAQGSTGIISGGTEVIIPASGETAEDIARASAVTVPNVILGGDLNIIYPNNEINSSFLAFNISHGKPQRDLGKKAQGKTVVHVRNSDIQELSIFYPVQDEQLQIASSFTNIDRLISLQSKKYEKLLNIKKAMLEKMFPKDGADVPEIRFKQFSAKWRIENFDSFFDSSLSKNTLSRANLTNEVHEVKNIHYGDILIKFDSVIDAVSDVDTYIKGSKIDHYKSQFLKDGDVIFADAAEDETVGKAIEIRNLKGQNIVSGLHTIPCRPRRQVSPYFLGYYLNSSSFHRQLLPLMQGTKVLSISKSSLIKTNLKIPVDQEEQEKIGKYFKNIDVLISLQSSELEKLKNMKKAMLEKMFV